MRFWAFQMMFVMLPSIIFMTYAQFQTDQIRTAENTMNKLIDEGKQDESVYSSTEYTKIAKKQKKLGIDKKKIKTNITTDGVSEVVWTPKIRMIYILHLIAKFAIECVFFYLSYLLQIQQSKKSGIAGFWVPEKYECTHGGTEENSACSQNPLIPCWVSRPWEKTIFMLYMTIVTAVSIAICLAEFVYVLTRTAKKGFERKGEMRYTKKQLTNKSLICDTNTIASSIHCDEKQSFLKKTKKNGIYPQVPVNGKMNGHAYGAPPVYPDAPPTPDEDTCLISDEEVPVQTNNSNNKTTNEKVEKSDE